MISEKELESMEFFAGTQVYGSVAWEQAINVTKLISEIRALRKVYEAAKTVSEVTIFGDALRSAIADYEKGPAHE